MITMQDIRSLLDYLNALIQDELWIEHYAHQRNPYRIMTMENRIVWMGSKAEIYVYLIGATHGINTYKAAHNIR